MNSETSIAWALSDKSICTFWSSSVGSTLTKLFFNVFLRLEKDCLINLDKVSTALMRLDFSLFGIIRITVDFTFGSGLKLVESTSIRFSIFA